MQDEIKLLNEKLDYLTEGSRRLHGLYNKSLEETRNLKTQLNTCKNQNGAIFATQSSNQDCQRIIEGNVHGICFRGFKHGQQKQMTTCRGEPLHRRWSWRSVCLNQFLCHEYRAQA